MRKAKIQVFERVLKAYEKRDNDAQAKIAELEKKLSDLSSNDSVTSATRSAQS